jgi:glycosyltransferase involved in cell wall biosynthesis
LVNFALGHSLRRLSHTATFENARDQGHMIEQGVFMRQNTKVIMGAGIDLSTFRPTERKAIQQPITFLLASRLIKAKGIAHYIEASKRISKSGLAGRFLLAGQVDKSDPDAFDVALEGRTNNLGPVEYLGSMGADEMPALLQKVDVVCLPTMLNEGFPRVLLEGAASGCAAIASDQASIRQLVVPEQTGWLIEAGNPDSLCKAMQAALSSPDQTRLLGINARHLIEELPVSDEAVVSSFLQLYGENTK